MEWPHSSLHWEQPHNHKEHRQPVSRTDNQQLPRGRLTKANWWSPTVGPHLLLSHQCLLQQIPGIWTTQVRIITYIFWMLLSVTTCSSIIIFKTLINDEQTMIVKNEFDSAFGWTVRGLSWSHERLCCTEMTKPFESMFSLCHYGLLMTDWWENIQICQFKI